MTLSLLDFPDEILLKIVEKTSGPQCWSTLMLTCHRFHNLIAKEESLWQDIAPPPSQEFVHPPLQRIAALYEDIAYADDDREKLLILYKRRHYGLVLYYANHWRHHLERKAILYDHMWCHVDDTKSAAVLTLFDADWKCADTKNIMGAMRRIILLNDIVSFKLLSKISKRIDATQRADIIRIIHAVIPYHTLTEEVRVLMINLGNDDDDGRNASIKLFLENDPAIPCVIRELFAWTAFHLLK